MAHVLVAHAQPVEDRQHLVDHRDTAHLARLRHVELAGDVVAPHVDQALAEVDVLPAQRAQLAEA